MTEAEALMEISRSLDGVGASIFCCGLALGIIALINAFRN